MFRLSIYDKRFPGIEVVSDGTTLFRVVKKNKVIDTFVRLEFGMQKNVSLKFAEEESKEFFNRLETSTLLKRVYGQS